MPIHATGNPRVDLLRPDLQAYYEVEADKMPGVTLAALIFC
jgi:hypothetical protein